MIRRATIEDASRIAEILIFTKRMNYRKIFQNDKVSFGEICYRAIELWFLWVLEKNTKAIQFYQRHGFVITEEKQYEEGTTEYIVKMKR